MTKLVVTKFGGSAIGVDGISIPIMIQRINEIKKNAKILAVFSAPLSLVSGQTRSLTDIVLSLGEKAAKNESVHLDDVRNAYEKILELVSSEYQDECKKVLESFLAKSQCALDDATQKGEFVDEVRSKALGFSANQTRPKL